MSATPTWLGADAQATGTAPSAITSTQTTITLASSSTFPVPLSGQIYAVRIDTTPASSSYEYCLVTNNDVVTNTLTVQRGVFGTSGHSFVGGATVTYVVTWEQLVGYSGQVGMFPRIDYSGWGSIANMVGIGPQSVYPEGTATPALDGQQFMMQAGSYVTTTTSVGGFNIPLPTTFPNGQLSASVMIGDVNQGDDLIITCVSNNMTANGINGTIYKGSSNSPLASATVRLNYISIGW